MLENKIIEKTFSYKLPDQYLYQTSNQNKTGRWTYRGPDKLWIFADEDTGKLRGAFHYTEKEDGATVPTPQGQIKILVEAEKDPIIASMVYNSVDYGTLPHTTEQLPDGAVYKCPNPTPPDHTYELTEIVYDNTNKRFIEPFPWKKPHMTWEELKSARDGILAGSDASLAKVIDPAVKQQWEIYRQKLRDLPRTFAGVDPWKVPFPNAPDMQQN